MQAYDYIIQKISGYLLPAVVSVAIYFIIRFIKTADNTMKELDTKSQDTLIKVTVLSERISYIDSKVDGIERKLSLIDKMEDKINTAMHDFHKLFTRKGEQNGQEKSKKSKSKKIS